MTVEKYRHVIPAAAEKAAVIVFNPSLPYWLDGVLLMHDREHMEWQTLSDQFVHVSSYGTDSVLLCGGAFDGEYGEPVGLPDIRYYAPTDKLEFYEWHQPRPWMAVLYTSGEPIDMHFPSGGYAHIAPHLGVHIPIGFHER